MNNITGALPHSQSLGSMLNCTSDRKRWSELYMVLNLCNLAEVFSCLFVLHHPCDFTFCSGALQLCYSYYGFPIKTTYLLHKKSLKRLEFGGSSLVNIETLPSPKWTTKLQLKILILIIALYKSITKLESCLRSRGGSSVRKGDWGEGKCIIAFQCV